MMSKWLVLLTLTIVLVGCGGGGDQAQDEDARQQDLEQFARMGEFVTGAGIGTGEYTDWQGVPLIPGFSQLGAVQIRGNESRMSYTVETTRQEFSEFYLEQMEKSGWELLSSEDGQEQNNLISWDWRKGTATLATVQADFSEDPVTFTIIIR